MRLVTAACWRTVCGLLLLALAVPSQAQPGWIDPPASNPQAAADSQASGYVARRAGIQQIFDALSSKLGKPIILSHKAARRQASGDFDFKNPWSKLSFLCNQFALTWYFDGYSVYVYDVSEIKSSLIELRRAQLGQVRAFLDSAGLYDQRFPIKGDAHALAFYVSGPPVYVDIVSHVARNMDQRQGSLADDPDQVDVIALKNTFVSDRQYRLRDQTVNIPGIATVLKAVLSGQDAAKPINTAPTAPSSQNPAAPSSQMDADAQAQTTALARSLPAPGKLNGPGFSLNQALPPPQRLQVADEPVTIQAVPENNSMLVRGRAQALQQVRQLVSKLDVAKRHVELALWIIDISKGALAKLGIQWSGSAGVGKLGGVSFNGGDVPRTALDGAHFLAQINALKNENQANIVTRPVVLTQENIPAIFDNSDTFYIQLTGERVAKLEHVTYGTMISVLPRVSGDSREVEMQLNIEDGNQLTKSEANPQLTLPTVHRTEISTVARVPMGKSLLIGGYARNQNSNGEAKIPLLGDIPLLGGLFRMRTRNADNTLRLFLIEPRVLDNGAGWQLDAFDSGQNPGTNSVSVARTLDKLRQYMDRHATR